MKVGGERDTFDPCGMVAFQFERRRELRDFHAGDKRVEPPATPIFSITQTVNGRPVRVVYYLHPRQQRSLAEVWGISNKETEE